MTTDGAARHWADQLAAWAIPDGILAQAPEPPWGFPAAVFKASARPQPSDSPLRSAALAALPAGGSVLDVGCGGGAAALALVPPAGELIGVDSSAELLELFAGDAAERGVRHRAVLGRWPDVAAEVPPVDVVVCAHVIYNVADIGTFVLALAAHARRRVVIEMTAQHPLRANAPLWKRFWDLDRPAGPAADDLVAVLGELGIAAERARSSRPSHRDRTDPSHTAMVRRRLCLPADREPEVADALSVLPDGPVDLVTLWWDVR